MAAAGFLLTGEPTSTVYREKLLEGLIKLASSKTEDVQFAVGEALVFAYGGLPLTFEAVLHSHFLTLADCPQLAEKADATGARALEPGVWRSCWPRSGDTHLEGKRGT